MVDQSRRRFTALMLGGVVVGMGGAAYAAVPAYRLFCQVTGFGGTELQLDGGVWAVQTPRHVLVVKHPFEAHYDAQLALTDRQDEAYAHAEEIADSLDGEVKYVDSFDLDRRPGWVYSTIAAAL